MCKNYQQLKLTLPNCAKGYSFPSSTLRLQWNKTNASSLAEFVNAIHVHGLTRLLPIFAFVCLYPTPVSLGASVGGSLQYTSKKYESLTLKTKCSKSTTKTTGKIIKSLNINHEGVSIIKHLYARGNAICCKWETNVALKKYTNHEFCLKSPFTNIVKFVKMSFTCERT